MPEPAMPSDAQEPEFIEAPRTVVGDTTVERLAVSSKYSPKGLLMSRDELAGWIGDFDRYAGGAGGDRARWLQAYDGGTLIVDRMKNPVPIMVPHFSVGIIGGVQPDKLHLICGGDDDGMAARFLYLWPDPVTEFALIPPRGDNETLRRALRNLHALQLTGPQGGHPRPQRVCLTPAARDLLEEVGGRLKALSASAHGPIAGMLGKGTGTLLRLANALSWLWWALGPRGMPLHSQNEIDEAALRAALTLYMDYFVPQARRVFGEAAIPETERNAMFLARWIVQHRALRINVREVSRKAGISALRRSEPCIAACDYLVEAGWLRFKGGTGAANRRRDYEVNPAVLAAPAP